MPFVEAMRQFQFRVGAENFANIHVSLVPTMATTGEQKTKPTQKVGVAFHFRVVYLPCLCMQSVRELRALGLHPDLLACRSEKPLEKDVKRKLAQFCMVKDVEVLTVYVQRAFFL